MKRFFFVLLALAALPCLLRANGDPVISYSAWTRASNPVPMKVSAVQVVREDLNIKLMVPYTEVSVVYRLKNASASPIHVDYGFPVDFDGRMDEPEGYESGGEYESLAETGIGKRAVRDVHFRLDGRELDWTHADSIVKIDEYENEDGETVDINVCRLWTYTVLDIPAGATVALEVKYSVLCNWSLGMYALQASPLSRYFPFDGNFSYDFSPAQHWGNGKADELNVTVDCSGLPKGFFDGGDISVGVNWLKPNGKVYSVTERNFDFASAGLLSATFYKDYGNPDKVYPSWGDPLKNCAVPASEYRLNVSGAQDKYPGSNLQDGSLETAWVAPGDGVGASVEIVFPQPRRVSDIAFYNGYHKSASLWSSNSRIKRMRVEVTRADGYVEFWESDLSEDAEWWSGHSYTLYESRAQRFGAVTLQSITNIEREMYGRETGIDEDGVYQYDKVPADAEKVSRIRLTVLETVPGTKYKDLCLSELSVLDGFVILDK